jgi:hypothetical protein
MSYVSSITTNYGDVDQVKNDVKVLNEILSRQGTRLLIDVLSSYAGDCINKYKMTDQERNNLVNSIIYDLNESLSERT